MSKTTSGFGRMCFTLSITGIAIEWSGVYMISAVSGKPVKSYVGEVMTRSNIDSSGIAPFGTVDSSVKISPRELDDLLWELKRTLAHYRICGASLDDCTIHIRRKTNERLSREVNLLCADFGLHRDGVEV